MKSLFKLTVLITCSAILFTACTSKTSKQGKLIPKDATIVVDINLKAISEQLSWDDIKKTSWYQRALTDTNTPPMIKMILEHPENNGIDAGNDIIMFLLKNGESSQFVVEGNLKDAKAFETINQNMLQAHHEMMKTRHWDRDTSLVRVKDSSKANATVSKDGDLNLLAFEQMGIVGWNQERFVYVFDGPDMGRGMLPFPMPGDGSMTKTESMVPSADRLKESCKNIFNLKEDNSQYKNEKLAKLLDEDGEIHYWMNTEQMLKGSMQFGMLNMLKLDKFIEGNMSGVTLKFDNGKISVHGKLYLGSELSDILKKENGSLNADMVKMLSGNKVAGVYAMHIRPETVQELLTLTGMDGFLNMFLSQQGVTIDDFIKATKGDVVLGVTDLQARSDTGLLKNSPGDSGIYRSHTPQVSMVFAVAINNKESFHKLLKAFEKANSSLGSSKITFKETDKYFVVGDSKESVDKYLSAKPAEHPFLDKIKSSQTGGYVDIQTILKAFQPEMRDSMDKEIYSMNVGMWENFYLFGGEWKDGGLNNNMEVNLVDKNTNSLKQLNKFFDGIARVEMAKHEWQMNQWKEKPVTDTIRFTPPKIVPKKISKKKHK